MRILGVSIASDGYRFALIVSENAQLHVEDTQRLVGAANYRSSHDLKVLRDSVDGLVQSLRPDVIAIRQNQVNGLRGAGPEAITMEAVLLLCAMAPVRFYSRQAVEGQSSKIDGRPKVWHDSIGAAFCMASEQP
jgi:hypothetical protein